MVPRSVVSCSGSALRAGAARPATRAVQVERSALPTVSRVLKRMLGRADLEWPGRRCNAAHVDNELNTFDGVDAVIVRDNGTPPGRE
jgi:hypothetical protein